MYDVVIIGAGVIGCAIARELSRYQARILVLERASDVCEGTSKANSGIIHAGYDAKPGTLKAKLNVIGNKIMTQLTEELQVPFKRNGSIVVCFEEQGIGRLQQLYDQGIENGVAGLSILSHEQCLAMEPMLSEGVIAGLYAKSAGIICPFTLTIALAENAFTNGVNFMFEETVLDIIKQECYLITTNKGSYRTKIVINAAGVYADTIHNMISKDKMIIQPRKGEYCLFDNALTYAVDHTIFQLPGPKGKGSLVTKTIHGNQLIGPSAIDTNEKEDVATSSEGTDEIIEKAALSLRRLDTRKIITSFAGLRAQEPKRDFIIEEVADTKGFFDVAGIASPGLTSAPAIAFYVRDLVLQCENFVEKPYFYATREPMVRLSELELSERQKLVEQQPEYGMIVCRCEMISEGEVLDAIRRPLGATTIDGVKRRTRAMMGRCQGGFCALKCSEILARERNIRLDEVTKHGAGSYLFGEKGEP